MENELERLKKEIETLKKRNQNLLQIGISLTTERHLESLLDKILLEARKISGSDAGSIYLKLPPEQETGPERIRFMNAQNDSMEVPFHSFILPIDDKSLAGYAANHCKMLSIENVYELKGELTGTFNSQFDKDTGYFTRSMMVIPMQNYLGEVIGVMQLMNKKKIPKEKLHSEDDINRLVISYDKDDLIVLTSLASQAGLCLERARLYRDFELLLDGFVKGFMGAIEVRDSTTSGHSKRIAAYALELAKAINHQKEGPFKDIHFSQEQLRELYFASQLHDIGKIGVPEALLAKARRLSDEQMKIIQYRIAYIDKSQPGTLDAKAVWDLLNNINQSGYLPEEKEKEFRKAINISFKDIDGETKSLLSEKEIENLCIRRGTLTAEERKKIEEHVIWSRKILEQIPWSRQMKNIPDIASTHHEKLDGSGYPDGLKKEEIPLGGRILAVLDIFEALTARDRPYRPPMLVEKALNILKQDVDAGKLDPDIYELFVREKLYQAFMDESGNIKFTHDIGSRWDFMDG